MEALIKKEVKNRLGFGLFISAAKYREEEAEIREQFSGDAKKIQNRYKRTEDKLTESMKKLLNGMVEEVKQGNYNQIEE